MSLLLDALKRADDERGRNKRQATPLGANEAVAHPGGRGESASQSSPVESPGELPVESPGTGQPLLMVAFVSCVVGVALLLGYQRISDGPTPGAAAPPAEDAVSAAITQRLTDVEMRNTRLDAQIELLKGERRELQQQVAALTASADAQRSAHAAEMASALATANANAARRERELSEQLADAASPRQQAAPSSTWATWLAADPSPPVGLRLERELSR